MGDQRRGELLLHEWATRNFAPIIALARSAQAFQDVPFNSPLTYQALDQAFPGAKFILTTRDDAEQWYRSLTRFHTKLVGKGRLPSPEDLKACSYRRKGWILEALQLVYGVSERDPYNKQRLIAAYEQHNRSVADYFKGRDASLVTINLAHRDVPRQLAGFLGVSCGDEPMPHLNQSV